MKDSCRLFHGVLCGCTVSNDMVKMGVRGVLPLTTLSKTRIFSMSSCMNF